MLTSESKFGQRRIFLCNISAETCEDEARKDAAIDAAFEAFGEQPAENDVVLLMPIRAPEDGTAIIVGKFFHSSGIQIRCGLTLGLAGVGGPFR